MSHAGARLRDGAETLGAALPPLLADAEHLARTVLLGEHGRRRSGTGDEFWQYRPAQPGDPARAVDWRRSARSDQHFVQEKEWQAAQSVHIWCDPGLSMSYGSDGLPTKADRARLLSLATSILLIRAGERVGLTTMEDPPSGGRFQLLKVAEALFAPSRHEFGTLSSRRLLPHARALFVSDFLGDHDQFERSFAKAVERGLRGVILQVLDPQEEVFPFDGRTDFESMGATLIHKTLRASGLRDRYLDRLAERKERLADLARQAGWQFMTHHTDGSAESALLWIYSGLERR